VSAVFADPVLRALPEARGAAEAALAQAPANPIRWVRQLAEAGESEAEQAFFAIWQRHARRAVGSLTDG
jgi:hypothetical protein